MEPNRDKYRKGWRSGLPETECGAGSTLKATKEQRKWIPEIIEKYNILSIADIGAGDLNWISKTSIPHYVNYQAYDLIPRHPEVKEFNLLEEIPPKVDLLMVLWVLNHFPLEESRQAIKNIKKSGAKYLMMTDRPRYHENQPPEIDMPFIEQLKINDEDSIKLIQL